MEINETKIYNLISTIPDPEIPVLSIVELGMIRKVHIKGDNIIIDLTPTYTGCPATDMIKEDVVNCLKDNGYENVHINIVIDPPWNTDWIGEEARKKLKKYGIAPPEKSTLDKHNLMLEPDQVHCPRCDSTHTKMLSFFGSTACKSLYKCLDCLEAFDYFKCHK